MTAKATISIRYFADTDNNTENRYITSTLATFALVSIILCTCRLSIFAIRAHVQCGFPTKAMISQAWLICICIKCAGSKTIVQWEFFGEARGGGGGGFALLFRLLTFVCLQSINLHNYWDKTNVRLGPDNSALKGIFLVCKWINNIIKSNFVRYHMHHQKNLSFLSSFGLRAVLDKGSKIAVFLSIVTSKRARWPLIFITFLSSSWLVTSVYQVSSTIHVRFFY